jgi:hypothetical protein
VGSERFALIYLFHAASASRYQVRKWPEVPMEMRPQVREMIRGYSIDELRERLKLRDEIQAIARGPESIAIEWLRRRRARSRLRSLRTDPGRD